VWSDRVFLELSNGVCFAEFFPPGYTRGPKRNSVSVLGELDTGKLNL
jgi:hypothetical protein